MLYLVELKEISRALTGLPQCGIQVIDSKIQHNCWYYVSCSMGHCNSFTFQLEIQGFSFYSYFVQPIKDLQINSQPILLKELLDFQSKFKICVVLLFQFNFSNSYIHASVAVDIISTNPYQGKFLSECLHGCVFKIMK